MSETINLDNNNNNNTPPRIAQEIGAGAIGVANYEILHHDRERLDKWLKEGCNDNLDYMAEHERENPEIVLPGCKSLIVVLFTPQKWRYHSPIRRRMKKLLKILQAIDPRIEGRGVVDTAPVMERAWGVKAGLGWQGRNSMLIHPDLGSDFNIGILLINRSSEELQSMGILEDLCYKNYQNITPHCDTCTGLCIENCPGGAIREDRMVDSRLCLSHISQQRAMEMQKNEGIEIDCDTLGCKICQEVCPCNK